MLTTEICIPLARLRKTMKSLIIRTRTTSIHNNEKNGNKGIFKWTRAIKKEEIIKRGMLVNIVTT